MSPLGPRVAPPVPPPTAGRRLLRRGRRRLGALRRVRPTVEGWIFLATSLAVSLAALNTGNNLLYLVFAAMLSLVALSGVLSESAVRRVRVRRRLDERVFAGEAARGTWFLENPRRFLPHLALRVDELAPAHADLLDASGAAVPWVPAGGRLRAPGRWTFERRGLHRLRGIRVSTTWPFGIFRKWYDLDSPTDVLVCPTPVHAPLPPPAAERRGGVRRSSRGGGRAEPRELRDWRDGEDRRLIHWRTSARRDRHIVVDREREDAGRVEIAVSATGGADRHARFEVDLSRATAQVLAANRAGRDVVLSLPDRPPLQGRGESGLAEMLRQLALADLGGEAR
jgi:uncharacterized protein (DUF58 family)